MIKGENQLTKSIRDSLKQGTKVEFKWHGSNNIYVGRIEVDRYNRLYFINEHNFDGDILIYEGMRYYNPLDSFYFFTYFKILS